VQRFLLLAVLCLMASLLSGCAAKHIVAPHHNPGSGWYCFAGQNNRQMICECDQPYVSLLDAKTGEYHAHCEARQR